MSIRMTKASLLEAIAGYPDDTPVVIDAGTATSSFRKDSYEWFEDYPVVWAVGNHTDAIVLEL